ncbi:hypothetical protein [Pediococcus acidilactici]|uniref:hypothetical protein n=1 Tax=Pediococcus acidilactici TaxID=1254 RepID=UPI001F4E08C2|nr:hypothetical protein [Pediococcus acidilactici]MCH9266450.1 hypothetical protein [Pediococcus acidilactici]
MVSEAIAVYKEYRNKINHALPIWPSGLGRIDDSNISYGLQMDNEILLAVEHSAGNPAVHLDLTPYGNYSSVEMIYPHNDDMKYNLVNGVLSLSFDHDKMARLFRLKK